MMERLKKQSEILFCVILFCTFLFLKYISPLVSPILLAYLVLVICYPSIINVSKRCKMKKGMVVTLVSALIVATIGLFILVICYALQHYFPVILKNVPVWKGYVYVFLKDCGCFMEEKFGMDISVMEEYMTSQFTIWIGKLQSNWIPDFLSNSFVYFQKFASVGIRLLVFFIALFLIGKEYENIEKALAEKPAGSFFVHLCKNILDYCVTYVRAQAMILLIISGVCMGSLSIFGVQCGYLWGFLAGLSDSLPFVGTGVVLVPLGIWHLIQGKIFQAIICFLLYIFCMVLREWLEPKWIGKGVGISPIWILLSIFAGIQLFGLWGIIKGPIGTVIVWQSYCYLRRT